MQVLRVKNGDRMKAVVIEGGIIRVKDVPKPKPLAKEPRSLKIFLTP